MLGLEVLQLGVKIVKLLLLALSILLGFAKILFGGSELLGLLLSFLLDCDDLLVSSLDLLCQRGVVFLCSLFFLLKVGDLLLQLKLSVFNLFRVRHTLVILFDRL